VRAKLKFIIIPYLIKSVIVLITMTCRVRWHNKEALDALNENNEGWIVGMWHNCSTFAPWAMRNRNITCMVSASRDGEYVARLGSLFGNKTVRGSSSKGSSAATRAVLRLLRKGLPIAMTPDGPRGPKYKVQRGILFLAAAGHSPILPFHIEASRQWVLDSWDDHRLPKPFSIIHIGIGEPTVIDKELLANNPEQAAQKVQKAMMKNVHYLQEQAAR